MKKRRPNYTGNGKHKWIVSTIKESDCLLVGGGSDGSKIVADIRTDYSSKEVIANASIISTAPELLAELKLISEHFVKNVTVFPSKTPKNGDFGPFCNTPPNSPNQPKIFRELLP